ncbi:MAG TPA: hypothetical protein VF529_03380 [Solirubrobacteraceae bacterium]
MLTALTPPGTAAQGRRVWLVSVTAYTVSGLAASVAVGAVLALIGRLSSASLSSSAGLAIAGALAGLAAARELSGGRLPLLQPRRMSSRAWARLGQPRAAILWGLDIGSFFTTRLTFAGAWWLAGVAVLSADIGLAASLFGAYWLGRAAPVWLGPWLVTSATLTPRLAIAWSGLEPRFRFVNAGAALGGTAALLIVFSG